MPNSASGLTVATLFRTGGSEKRADTDTEWKSWRGKRTRLQTEIVDKVVDDWHSLTRSLGRCLLDSLASGIRGFQVGSMDGAQTEETARGENRRRNWQEEGCLFHR
jgi:hypothetical protein